jgi:hypothetical protein
VITGPPGPARKLWVVSRTTPRGATRVEAIGASNAVGSIRLGRFRGLELFPRRNPGATEPQRSIARSRGPVAGGAAARSRAVAAIPAGLFGQTGRFRRESRDRGPGRAPRRRLVRRHRTIRAYAVTAGAIRADSSGATERLERAGSRASSAAPARSATPNDSRVRGHRRSDPRGFVWCHRTPGASGVPGELRGAGSFGDTERLARGRSQEERSVRICLVSPNARRR